jgi:hypothetical protein
MSRFPTRPAIQSQYQDNLSEEDQRTYRRWLWGLYAFYGAVIAVTVILNCAFPPPAGDLRASDEGAKQLTAAASRSGFGANVAAERK